MDAALRISVTVIDNRAMGHSPAYTFVEKMQTINTKFRNEQSLAQHSGNQVGNFPKNFLSHYYDLCGQLDSPEVQAFVGKSAYHAPKPERFRPLTAST